MHLFTFAWSHLIINIYKEKQRLLSAVYKSVTNHYNVTNGVSTIISSHSHVIMRRASATKTDLIVCNMYNSSPCLTILQACKLQ